MIENALKEYLSPSILKKTALFSLYCPEWILQKKSFFQKKHYAFSIVLSLHGALIPTELIFQNLESIFDEIGLNASIAKKISWFVLSPKGGIYLYETIATKEHRKYKNLRNSFIIVNTESASISFGPGHTKNPLASQMLFSLLQNSRFFKKEEWLGKMFDFFTFCEHTV